MATSLQKMMLSARQLKTAGTYFLTKRPFSETHICLKNKIVRSPDVCLSSDKNMILCWHPEPEFPYENTKPLPRDKTELEEGDSVLKVQYLVEDKLKNRPEGPTLAELSQIFHRPQFTFKRRPRHEKKTEMIKYKPKDRDGL